MRLRLRRSQNPRARMRRRWVQWLPWLLWINVSRRSRKSPALLTRQLAKFMTMVTVMKRCSIGTSRTHIDGAALKVCWTLGAVVTKFSFVIALLCMVYLVRNLMVLFIQFQWFPIISIVASEKWTKSARALKDREEKSLFGTKTEREIVSSSMHMSYLKKQIILDLFHCVSWLILALLLLLISLSLRGTTYHGDNERSLSG